MNGLAAVEIVERANRPDRDFSHVVGGNIVATASGHTAQTAALRLSDSNLTLAWRHPLAVTGT